MDFFEPGFSTAIKIPLRRTLQGSVALLSCLQAGLFFATCSYCGVIRKANTVCNRYDLYSRL